MTHYKSSRQKQVDARRRKAFTPLFGLISAVIFGAFAWVIAPQLLPYVDNYVTFPADLPAWGPNAVVALIIFVVLFALGMALVAVFAGAPHDPRDVRTSSKQMMKEMRSQQRRRSKY